VPCTFGLGSLPMILSKSEPWPWFTPYHVKSLKKRLDWIAKCGALAGGMMHHLINKKTNTSMYYFEAMTQYRETKVVWGYAKIAQPLEKPVCYYLGKFPNYWNVKAQMLCFAHDTLSEDYYSMGSKPEIPGLLMGDEEKAAISDIKNQFSETDINTYMGKEIRSPADMEAFWNTETGTGPQIQKAIEEAVPFGAKEDRGAFVMQDILLTKNKKQFDECIAKRFPKTAEEPKPKAAPAQKYEPFTQTPIPQMQLPTPTQSAQAPTTTEEKKISLNLNFLRSETTQENALQALFPITESKE
jgi:hypothetical protein